MKFGFEGAGSKKELNEDYLKNLAERVKKLIGERGFISACNLVLNSEGIRDKVKRKQLRSEIGRILGSRGAERKETLKLRAKEAEKPHGVFTRAQLKKMTRGAEELQAQEERRAGQTYEDSGLE